MTRLQELGVEKKELESLGPCLLQNEMLVKLHYDYFVNNINVEKPADSQFSFSACNVDKALLAIILLDDLDI